MTDQMAISISTSSDSDPRKFSGRPLSFKAAERISKHTRKIHKKHTQKSKNNVSDSPSTAFKIYRLKHMGQNIIDPYKQVKSICDLVFPLDRQLHPSNISLVNPANYFAPFGSLFNFKRIILYTIKTSNETHKYRLEEKWPNSIKNGFTDL